MAEKEFKNKLDTRVLCAFGSINDNDKILTIESIKKMFIDFVNVSDFYFICHDDTNTLHYHYLIKLKKQTRLSTIINFIADYLSINTLAINIDKCRGFNQCLRYMLHIDDSSKIDNKKVFDVADIVSNDNIENINNFLQSDDDDLMSFEFLIKGVLKYSKTSDLIKYFGLKNYHKYRFEIRDLLDEKLNSPKLQMDYQYLIDDLPF